VRLFRHFTRWRRPSFATIPDGKNQYVRDRLRKACVSKHDDNKFSCGMGPNANLKMVSQRRLVSCQSRCEFASAPYYINTTNRTQIQ
jgi:hypothetical protein